MERCQLTSAADGQEIGLSGKDADATAQASARTSESECCPTTNQLSASCRKIPITSRFLPIGRLSWADLSPYLNREYASRDMCAMFRLIAASPPRLAHAKADIRTWLCLQSIGSPALKWG